MKKSIVAKIKSIQKAVKGNKKGFSTSDVLTGLAVMGIAGAALMPSFEQIISRSQIKSDIRSIQTLNEQYDLYLFDVGKDSAPTTFDEAITALVDEKLIDSSYVEQGEDSVILKLQSELNANFDKDTGFTLTTDGSSIDDGLYEYLETLSGGTDGKYIELVEKVEEVK